MAAAVLLLTLLGCGSEPPAPASQLPAAPPVAPDAVERGPLVIPAGEGDVAVTLAFQGVGNLHKGYFRTDDLVEAMGAGMGGCVADPAEVLVSWDSDENLGTILLHTVGTQLGCKPVAVDGGYDAGPLVPIGRALAAYRDGVANRFDLRVASFRTGVRVIRGTQVCDVWFAGQFPPDGTTVSPCAHLQGHEVCGPGHARDGVTKLELPADGARQLHACFK